MRGRLVRGQRQEVDVVVGQRDLLQNPERSLEVAVRVGVAELGADLAVLLLHDVTNQLGGDEGAIVELGAVVDPLPDLRAGDLGGGSVLHEVVDADGTESAEPRLEVARGDLDVAFQAGPGDLALRRGDVEQVLGGHVDVVAQDVELVRPVAEDSVEDLLADGHEVGVRHPGAVEALAGLPLLVLADLGEGLLVGLLVLAARDEG